MTTPRESPPRSRIAALGPRWEPGGDIEAARPVTPDVAARLATVALADWSLLGKTGLKGPHAAAWLEGSGIPVPQKYNTWTGLAGGGLVARLAVSEFFIEDAPGGAIAAGVARELESAVAGVWPVLRQDAGIALTGARVGELLAQTCSFNFGELGAEDRTAVMTSMVGVAVLAMRRKYLETPCYRIWCDPTYGPYLWDTLAEIAVELGGGPVGTQAPAAQEAS